MTKRYFCNPPFFKHFSTPEIEKWEETFSKKNLAAGEKINLFGRIFTYCLCEWIRVEKFTQRSKCFFAGGIILGNYLAEKGENARSKLLAAILISVCFDTFEGTKSLETPGLNRMLNRHLANALVESIKEVKHHFESNKMWNLEQVFSSTTVREFDNR